MKTKVLIRGGGDLASAIIHKLHRSGFDVICCELPNPKMVRRTVSYSNAIYEGHYSVEGIEAVFVEKLEEIEGILKAHKIPVVVNLETEIMYTFKPEVFVDATLTKKKVNYDKNYAPVTIGLGPNIEAGVDADVVIETARGHDLGRLIFKGYAAENTHIPGNIGGFTHERVLRAPCDGKLTCLFKIGDQVNEGDCVAKVDGQEVHAKICGVIRGLIHENVTISKGLKIGDIDPRGDQSYCYSISDKGRNIAGGVLEAILYVKNMA